jgi:hypothetical protein
MQLGMLGGGACLEWVFSCSDGWQISIMFSRHITGGREKVGPSWEQEMRISVSHSISRSSLNLPSNQWSLALLSQSC